ncbi:MAG TPA: hypothetical protein VMU25_04900 [Candidatus Paceibacterota bacterium]|nr:hypothetical protein [Candidatus Paceibacterota bacterium]
MLALGAALEDRNKRTENPRPGLWNTVPGRHYHRPRGPEGPAYEIHHAERGPDGMYRDPSRPLGSALNPVPPGSNPPDGKAKSYTH